MSDEAQKLEAGAGCEASEYSALLYFRRHETGAVYKTGGQYKNGVWFLAPFGWIISALYERGDLEDTSCFTQITEAEI